MKLYPSLVLFCTMLLTCSTAANANWTIEHRGSVSVSDTGNIDPSEFSGVTYLGPSPILGRERFLAAQDSNADVAVFDVEFSSNGTILSTNTVSDISLVSSALDFEGIAYNDSGSNTVFMSYEQGPGVREYSLSTGTLQQNITIPLVFSNIRNNRGFESLARSADGSVMWTANEESLNIDGPVASTSNGTTVRLLELLENTGSYQAGAQYAYEVEPIHSGGFVPERSGLSDLVVLPDGTLIALERSLNLLASPSFLTSIYQVDFTGATDISAASFDTGLVGKTYTPVTKQLLWSGAGDGSSGQNFEGLALGSQLADGSWVLLGVSDDGGSSTSSTIASWQLTPNFTEDLNNDGFVDGLDLGILLGNWNTNTTPDQGELDGTPPIDGLDLGILLGAWNPPPATNTITVPEPDRLSLVALALLLICATRLVLR